VSNDPVLKVAISCLVIFGFANKVSNPGGALGHGLLCLTGFSDSSAYHFF